jgi:hypothetical protein
MPNRTFIDDEGLLWQVYEGDQNGDTLAKILQQTEMLLQTLRAKKAVINVLVDINKIGRQNLESRKVAAKAMKDWPFHKVAVFGTNAYLRHVVNLVAIATGHRRNAQFFANETLAKAWLKKP